MIQILETTINHEIMNKLLTFFLFLFSIVTGYSQVTIGVKTPPEKAVLLELKTQEANNPISTNDVTNVTSTKGGLILPRVQLVSKITLEPFIPTANPIWQDAITSKIKEKHAGLTVYNIYKSADGETDRDKIFNQGVYTWDGNRWRSAFSGKRFFACPTFSLPLPWISRPTDENFTYDLYAEYEKQYTKGTGSLFTSNNASLQTIASKSLDRLYKRHELDYVVTYYDQSVLKISEIDENGVMSYDVLNHAPDKDVFINLIFVIKE